MTNQKYEVNTSERTQPCLRRGGCEAILLGNQHASSIAHLRWCRGRNLQRSRTVNRSLRFESRLRAPSPAAIARDDGGFDCLGERDIHGIVCTDVVSQLPRTTQQIDMGMTVKIEVDEIRDRFVGTRGETSPIRTSRRSP